MEDQTVQEGKTTAIISYLTIIGLIAAFIMNKDKKNSFASFHIRQMIGLTLLGFVINVISRSLASVLGAFSYVFSLALIVLWVIAFVGALQGKKNLVPILGEKFQEWFKNI